MLPQEQFVQFGNYQTEGGVNVPEVLQPYLGGLKFMPFVHKEVPVAKGAKGQKDSNKPQKKKEEKNK